MEEICTTLSAQLCEAGTGGYKIYYEEELLDALPDDMRNRETLEAALKNLSGGGYIDVKYARGNAFCICSFKRYEPVVKEEPAPVEAAEAVAVNPAPSIPKRFYAISALCAFAGGALGGCVAAVLGAVL
ncbi:MAG: hypothetical protein K2O44_04795 [Clostridia bacterium]|nr:hypothetical protein [Clostridia bacterium]